MKNDKKALVGLIVEASCFLTDPLFGEPQI